MGIGRAARLAGLLHDLGKYNPAFQAYIARNGSSVDHSTAGARIVSELNLTGLDRVAVDLIAYAIAGHHTGLPDRQGGSPSSLNERLNGFVDVLDPVWKNELAPETMDLLPRLRWVQGNQDKAAFQLALLGRMIFSCLVDADYRNTEQFYAEVEGREVDRQWPTLAELLPGLQARFDAYMSAIPASNDTINLLRQHILVHARGKAALPPGLFTLTVPTGGGKTLTSLGFALDHARNHGLSRIIYAIPFTSIVDQTASIFRDVLGEDAVLEHHSAIDDERHNDGDVRMSDSRDQIRKLQRAMEDWAPAIVVTTNVQLFESLFASRASRARKLHNIAGSVIILDEAHAIPLNLLGPAVWTLEALARDYGCTIVLCTATQPALDGRRLDGCKAASLIGLDLGENRELAPDPPALARQLRRTKLTRGGEMNDDSIVEALTGTPQALVIVNSRQHALALYRTVATAGLEGVVHLSTRQYAFERKRILDEVRRRLKAKEPCRLIATSLVEAGVDLDFPRVWRAEAGLEQIVQAAGRCNREGRRLLEDSVVTVFSAPDNPPPSEIKGFISDRQRMEGNFNDLFAPDAIARYFEEVYWRKGPEHLDCGIIDKQSILRKFALSPTETIFSYRSAAENFRMIDSGMVPVIVPADEATRRAVEQLTNKKVPSGKLARELQSYVVSIPPKARQQLIRFGHVRFEVPEIRGEEFAVLQNTMLYDHNVGLLWEDPTYMAAEALIIS